ncbi:MAG TPA: hypothetical protein DCG34_11350 [Clostridiales bacterium]|nr:hypothetical protein [Clostridiales bacterium]
MNRNSKFWIKILICFIFLGSMVAIMIYFNRSTKIEMMEKSDDGLSLTFSSLSQSVSHQLELESSHVLLVESIADRGTIRLSVTSSNGNVIYTGGIKKAYTFMIRIKEPGLYSIVVSGRNTSGNISIQRKKSETKLNN